MTHLSWNEATEASINIFCECHGKYGETCFYSS